jgi:hypothetical protein
MTSTELRTLLVGLAAALSALAVAPTPAPSPKPKIVVSGRVRAYNFARSYRTGTTDTQASSLGLKLHAESTPHNGLGVGLTYYSAYPFSDGGIVPAELETSLPGVKLNTLAEAYAQYTSRATLIRVGRQTLATPFANAADSRVIPVTFEGIGVAQALSPVWTLFAYRIDRTKNRTAATFTPTSFVTATPTGGFAALGLTRSTKRGTFQLWAYQFDRISSLLYADGSSAFATGRTWHASAAAQYASENGATGGVLGSFGEHLYGARLGAGSGNLELVLAYDRVPAVLGAYKSGALLSPYTFGDNADPLYTTLIGASLVEKASPGQAYVVSSTYTSENKRFKGILARGRFDLLTTASIPKNELYESDADVAYNLLRPRSATDPHGLWFHERFFVQDTTVKPYKYEQNRLFVDYTW